MVDPETLKRAKREGLTEQTPQDDGNQYDTTTDCSEIAAKFRDKEVCATDGFYPDIARHINDSFSLDYETKAWRLFSDDEWM